MISVIIVSDSSKPEFRQLTCGAIASAQTCDNVVKQIIVVETSGELYHYDGAESILMDGAFNYNKCLNIGYSIAKYDYLAFCNNDLVFYENCFSEIIKAFEAHPLLASQGAALPDNYHFKTYRIDPKKTWIVYGYEHVKHLSGWAIFTKRETINKIGLFDERFKFYYADNEYLRRLSNKNLKNALNTRAIIAHIGHATASTLPAHVQHDYTIGQAQIFNTIHGRK